MTTLDPSTPSSSESHSLKHKLRSILGDSRGQLLVNWVNFGDGIVYFGVLTLMTLFMEKNVGFTTNMSTFSVSVFTGMVTLFMLGAGSLTDWLGARRALTLSLAVSLVGRIALVLAPSVGQGSLSLALPSFMGSGLLVLSHASLLAWISVLVMGVGEGAIQPAMYAGIKEYTRKGSATMGYAYLYAIMNLGIVVGEFVSPLVRAWYAKNFEGLDIDKNPTAGITGALWFFIGVNALILAVNLLFFTKKVEQRDRVETDAGEPDKLRVKQSFAQKLKALPILDLRFLFFIFVLLPVRTLFAHQWLTIPHYVTRAFPPGVGAKLEWLGMLNPLVIVVTVPLIAAFTKKARVVDMMIIGTTITALSTFLLLPDPNLPLLLGYIVLFTLGEAVWSSRFLEYVADLAPAGKLGIYMGIAGLPWFLAKFVTGTYAGWMLDHFVPEQGAQHPGGMWLIYGLTALLSPIGLVLARRWLLSRETAAAA